MSSGVDREKLRALVKEHGPSARAVSLRAGLGATAVKDILSGKSQDPGFATIQAIAAALDVSAEQLMVASPDAYQPSAVRMRRVKRQIPVLGEVAAGLWREATQRELMRADEFIDLDVAGYESATLYALKVVGPSMNMFYPNGRYVVIAPAAEAGVRVGDHVVVERYRAGLVEVTIKELNLDEGGRALLWPKSTDPAFQEPLPVRGEAGDQDAPKIVGVVVADYGRRERPNVMFLPGGS
jgi:SOS-response transcriptional repressor LexA